MTQVRQDRCCVVAILSDTCSVKPPLLVVKRACRCSNVFCMPQTHWMLSRAKHCSAILQRISVVSRCAADVVAEQGGLPHLPHPFLSLQHLHELRPGEVKWESYRPEPLMSQPGGLLTIVRPYPKPSPTCMMPPMRVPSSNITMPTCEMNCPRHNPHVRDWKFEGPEPIV